MSPDSAHNDCMPIFQVHEIAFWNEPRDPQSIAHQGKQTPWKPMLTNLTKVTEKLFLGSIPRSVVKERQQ